jgi:hypothetical protein
LYPVSVKIYHSLCPKEHCTTYVRNSCGGMDVVFLPGAPLIYLQNGWQLDDIYAQVVG